MGLKSVKKNLDSIVYNLLIESFFNEEYRSGQVINPTEVAEKYEISKTPVLQALKRLSIENVLEVSSTGKYALIAPTKEKIADICELRYMFEEAAVKSVIENFSEKDKAVLLELAENCSKMKTNLEPKEVLRADYSFHKKLVELKGNDNLFEVYEIILNRYIILKYSSGYENRLEGILEKSYVSHKHIVELMEKKDLDSLLGYLKDHIYFHQN